MFTILKSKHEREKENSSTLVHIMVGSVLYIIMHIIIPSILSVISMKTMSLKELYGKLKNITASTEASAGPLK